MRFTPGNSIRNLKTNEGDRVSEAYETNGMVITPSQKEISTHERTHENPPIQP